MNNIECVLGFAVFQERKNRPKWAVINQYGSKYTGSETSNFRYSSLVS